MTKLLVFSVPSFESTNFTVANDRLESSWTISDECSAKTGFTVTGHNTVDATDKVTTTATASYTSAQIPTSTFTVCARYLFDIAMTHAFGDPVVSTMSTEPLTPNAPGN